jgi:ornithine carbamoyltransferase
VTGGFGIAKEEFMRNSQLPSKLPAAAEIFSGHFSCSDLISTRDLGPQGMEAALHLLLTCACLGSSIQVATPKDYAPNAQIVAGALQVAKQTGAQIEFLTEPHAAVAGVDAVYTDAWTSMGQEHEAKQRAGISLPYQVNRDLMAEAALHSVFMHCLPAHRGQEVTDEVMDSDNSIIFEQAENRLHVQKAILYLLLGGSVRLPARSAHA